MQFLQPVSADIDNYWQGYINNKTFQDYTYGYLFVNSNSTVDEKLRLICHAPDTFMLLVPRNIEDDQRSVQLTVDSLPTWNFPKDTIENNSAVSMSTNGFWDLLAQMAAGAQLKIGWPNQDTHYEFSLQGFTRSFTDQCGWLAASRSYLPYLDKYR
jgi:hypothetical protein